MRLIDADPSLASRPDVGSGVSDRARSLWQCELSDLSQGDLAFCLRQGIGVAHLAPLAIGALTVEPLLEAELYPGDLLTSLLHAEAHYGLGSDTASDLAEICSVALTGAESIQEIVVPAAAAFVASRAGT
ncbi:hypothetical protein C0063_06295 [Pseudoxanthomonas sp. KAs_5_3]|nr:hypothetical protein C0063_06295 [Pseudoxanthomonas sp. KAs_5_3]